MRTGNGNWELARNRPADGDAFFFFLVSFFLFGLWSHIQTAIEQTWTIRHRQGVMGHGVPWDAPADLRIDGDCVMVPRFSAIRCSLSSTLGISLALWLIGVFNQITTTGSPLITYLSLNEHYYYTFLKGIIDLKDVVFYLSVTILSLFIGSISFEMRRWR